MGWRARFVFLLMVYVAGFATAIYVMTPTQEGQGFSFQGKGRLREAIQPRQFAQSVNTGLSKCADMSKTIAEHASVIIKEQLDERRKSNASKNES
ncbi:MAG: hypothetical protein HQ515_16250 [Phycisphaeraceae bacterium]|nr:hypothetical protein [Phycisphaeraceae bacterium]